MKIRPKTDRLLPFIGNKHPVAGNYKYQHAAATLGAAKSCSTQDIATTSPVYVFSRMKSRHSEQDSRYRGRTLAV